MHEAHRADTRSMKTQIRPRVLIPVITLAVAVGAAAVWKLSGSGNEEPSPSTEAAQQVGEAADGSVLPGQPTDVATASGDWASQANAICTAELGTANGDAAATPGAGSRPQCARSTYPGSRRHWRTRSG